MRVLATDAEGTATTRTRAPRAPVKRVCASSEEHQGFAWAAPRCAASVSSALELAHRQQGARRRMDVTTIVGLLIALGCILGGQVLEGGHVSSIAQLAAGLIVIGGTFGAVVTQFPAVDLVNGLRQCRFVILTQDMGLARLARDLVELSRKSRREGLLVLEDEASKSTDPFLRQALLGLVDGNDVVHLRALLDSAIDQQRQVEEPGPKLLEAAGGYAPTIGILGAVLGLIHVMENLSDPSRLGSGIAVAFVATVYGVGAANLIFLPLAQKLRLKMNRAMTRKEMIVEAVCAIQEGVNPQMLEKRLQSFVGPVGRAAKSGGTKAPGKAAPPRATARR